METSTMSKSLFSRHERAFLEHEVPEESTWTMYFQDFCNNNNNNVQESQDPFCYDNSSLISDAASFAGAAAATVVRKTSGSKKRRTFDGTRNFVGNDLEDTASSPSTSPKVFSVADERNGHKTEEDMRRTNQERMELGLEGEDKELTELKKKGLCLVPLSMLTNYIA